MTAAFSCTSFCRVKDRVETGSIHIIGKWVTDSYTCRRCSLSFLDWGTINQYIAVVISCMSFSKVDDREPSGWDRLWVLYSWQARNYFILWMHLPDATQSENSLVIPHQCARQDTLLVTFLGLSLLLLSFMTWARHCNELHVPVYLCGTSDAICSRIATHFELFFQANCAMFMLSTRLRYYVQESPILAPMFRILLCLHMSTPCCLWIFGYEIPINWWNDRPLEPSRTKLSM